MAGLLFAGSCGVQGQIPWDEAAWRVQAAESRVEMHLGREALFLRNGTAWLDGVAFRDGVIEFDMAASSNTGFHGVRFRAVDDRNHEHLYLRPHLSGKADATQYNPIYNGVSSWQIFTDPRYIQPLDIPADRWVRVRVAISDQRAEVSLDGGEPIVFPDLIRDAVAGPVGLNSSAAPAWFANVVVSPGADPDFRGGEGAPPVEPPVGTVSSFRVSPPFAESAVDGVARLPSALTSGGSWVVLDTEKHGIANLARARVRTPDENTVFAAVTLRASAETVVPVDLGFSDRIRVFLNGRQLFAAADGFATRDYRFLGSMGHFDTVFLQLEEGDNELWLAVSETFGGWGVSLRVPEAAGVRVVPPS